MLRVRYIVIIVMIWSLATSAANDRGNVSQLSNKELSEKGKRFMAADKPDSALFYFSILNNRYTSDMGVDDQRLCAKSMIDAGQLYYVSSNYPMAIDLLLHGLEIAEKNGFKDAISDAYKNIGNVYSTFSDYERSCELYKKAYEYARQSGDIRRQSRVLTNLVGAYCFNHDIKRARYYYDLLLMIPDKSIRYNYDTMVLKSLILSGEGEYQKATTGYRKVLDFVTDNKMDIRIQGTVRSCLGKVYEARNNLDSAIYFFRGNEKASREAGQMDLLVETLRDLSKAYEKKGDINRSMRYKSEYLELSDSMFNQVEFNSVKNAQLKYEMDKDVAMINDLRGKQHLSALKIAMQRNILLIVSAILAIMVFLLFVAYWQKRKLANAYNALFDRNKECVENEVLYKSQITELETKLLNYENGKVTAKEITVPRGSLVSDEQRTKILCDIRHIMEHDPAIFDNGFSIDKLAELIGSNSRYVSDVINREYKKSFRSFVNDYRIREAMIRLADHDIYGHLTIKAIAEGLGYNSQSNFITAFSRVAGMKPSVYQKIARERAAVRSDNKAD